MTMSTMTAPRRKALAACLVGLVLAMNATAAELALPRMFDDLRPKFEAVSLGMTPEEVQRVMGAPDSRTETQTMGVPHLSLSWGDRSYEYAARFLAGRLYFKQLTNAR